jgi:hypothetical protein
MTRVVWWARAAIVVSAGSIAWLGCGGPQWQGQWYQHGDVGFFVGVLNPSWRREAPDAHDSAGPGMAPLVWAHHASGALIQVRASCEDALDIPLRALTRHLLIGFTDVTAITEQLRPLDGREALRSKVHAKLDGVPRELVLYVIKKNGCVYDFALIARPQGSAVHEPEFDRFVSGFSTDRK